MAGFQQIIECVYFKPSGKFYTEGKIQDVFPDLIYPKEFGNYLQAQKKLPGLESGTWPGPFVVRVNGGYWELCNATVQPHDP